MITVFSATFVMILSLVAANTAGHTKKAVTAGAVWVAYSASNGVAPLLVRTQEEAKHYPTAFIVIISMISFTFVLLLLYRNYVFYLNRRKDNVRLVDKDAAAMTGHPGRARPPERPNRRGTPAR